MYTEISKVPAESCIVCVTEESAGVRGEGATGGLPLEVAWTCLCGVGPL